MESSDIIGSLIGILIVIGTIALYIFRRNLEKKKKLTPSDSLFKLMSVNKQQHTQHKQIFINYRRDDSSGYSLALYNELLKWYDKKDIFKDFHNIEPGEDFEHAIDEALDRCGVLIVVIADKWTSLIAERVKLNSPDYVNQEIATALLKDVYVIPVTINGTAMPNEPDLPTELKKLTRRQSLNIDQIKFENDVRKLVDIIDRRLNIQRKS